MRHIAIVIEDEPELATFLAAVFDRVGFDTIAFESFQDAIESLGIYENIAVLLSNITGDEELLAGMKEIAARWPSVRLMVLSERFNRLSELPPATFISKPTNARLLIATIRHVCERTLPVDFRQEQTRDFH